jgi:hypothetical protein
MPYHRNKMSDFCLFFEKWAGYGYRRIAYNSLNNRALETKNQ